MEYKIEMKGITKKFGSLVANDNVSISVKKGEIHALLGENGAGKSTLMSILFGLYKADSGEIIVNGSKAEINNPNDANELGIGMVHQHFKLVETFTVLENIILGSEDVKYGLLNHDDAIEKLNNIIETYSLNVDLNSYISDITVGQQQRVEILKMLYRDSDILIFDEPTSVLAPQEIVELISIMKGFAKEGKTIIIITHKLNEIKAVADNCSVLRRGKKVGQVKVGSASVSKLAEMMVGKEVSFTIKKSKIKKRDKIFEVQSLSVQGENKLIVKDVSFSVFGGEILGIAGIDGNGQTELIYGITGLGKISSGKVILNGLDITKLSIRKKNESGMAHIPEDRQKHGVIMDFDLNSNLVMQNYYQPKFQKNCFLNFEAIKKNAEILIERFDIRSEGDGKTIVRSMSGGNQQKAILGREISREHDLLIAVQPTRGLDVGAIEHVHKKLLEEREQGKALLLVSLEIEEVLNLSDRVLVIFEGEIVGEFDPKKVTINDLGMYMSGAKRGPQNGKN